MKRNLILISPMLHQGGFERVCITTARLLEPYYNVTIVIFDDANIAYDITGLRIRNLDLGVRKGRIGKVLNVFRRAGALRKVKKELSAVAAYSFGPTANYVNCLSKTPGTKVIAGLRNYTDVEDRGQMKLFLKQADLVIGCSESIREALESRYGYSKGVTLYNPFDLIAIRQQAEEPGPELPWDKEKESGRKLFTLVAMGRIAPQKGFWHLIKAFALVHRKYDHTRLLILGAGHFEKYGELADRLGCGDAVYYAGMRKDPFACVKKGDLYVLSSENEGFPNVLVEAMTLGLPVISVDCESGPREILLSEEELASCPEEMKEIKEGAYGILCPRITKGENFDPAFTEEGERFLAEAMERLITDETLYRHYQDRSYVRAEDFRMEKYRDDLLGILQDLTEKKKVI